MNKEISTEVHDRYLRLLRRAIVLGRAACQAGDSVRAEAILDAVHNVPSFLMGKEPSSFERDFRQSFLDPLIRRYPDLEMLEDGVGMP